MLPTKPPGIWHASWPMHIDVPATDVVWLDPYLLLTQHGWSHSAANRETIYVWDYVPRDNQVHQVKRKATHHEMFDFMDGDDVLFVGKAPIRLCCVRMMR